jgi:hypothetical protein
VGTQQRDAEPGTVFSRGSAAEYASALARAGGPNPVMVPRRPEDLNAMKEAAYEARNRALSEAWRRPAGLGDPSRAAEIERQRRLVTYEDR